MTTRQWAQIKEVFDRALELKLEERPAFLDQACGSDAFLRHEIDQLLRQHDEMGGFLDAQPDDAATRKHALSEGEIVAVRYRIVRLLGEGGMGEVYEAEDLELRVRIALKVVRPDLAPDPLMISRFHSEIQLSRQVTHPNVCRVFDIGRHQEPGRALLFFTMELLAGETLAARLTREHKLDTREALRIAVELCAGLEAAHRAGVIHRDFKSANVILVAGEEGSRPVITDFGLARVAQSDEERADFTRTNASQVLGTPAYIAPEQLLGDPVTPATDLYSLGIVLYEMVTGQRPFTGDSALRVSMKRLAEAPPAPRDVSPGVSRTWNAVILRCLERLPAARFASAREVAEALQTGLPRARFGRWYAAVAALLIVAALAGFAWWNRFHASAPALPSQKHIAVLQFTSAAANPADRALSDGVADSLAGRLAQLQPYEKSLWVVPGSEVRAQGAISEARARGALGVNLLITGALQRTVSGVRVVATLKDADGLRKLRSEVIDVPAAGLAALPDLLFQKTAAMLELSPPSQLLNRLRADETRVPGAYEFYESARGYLHSHKADEIDSGIALCRKAIESDPNFALAHAELGLALHVKYVLTGDPKLLASARASCDRALQLDPQLAVVHVALGEMALDVRDFDRALREFQEALRQDPNNAETLSRLGSAYDSAGNLLAAERTLRSAVDLNPSSWLAYNYLGRFYFRHGQYSQAETAFIAVTQLAPDNPLGFSNLGGVYLALGNYNETERVLRRSLDLKPSLATYSNLGTALFYQNKFTAAVPMFRKAAELRPDDDRPWRNLGDAQLAGGQAGAAMESYRKAKAAAARKLASGRDNPDISANLALYDAHLGASEAALKRIAEAVRRAPADVTVLFKSALVYETAGDRGRALEALAAALRGGYSREEIEHAPELRVLRKDPRFLARNP
jgi:tetratricopeptide (TPR) repeat protein